MSNGNPKTERDMSGTGPEDGADAPFFAALLTPYRSLGTTGFSVLMAVTGGVCLIAGLGFLALGAWPVFGFLGLDILLIYLAFRWNYKAANAYEEVRVSRTEILVRKVNPRGRHREYRFNPFWARLHVRKEEDEGVVRITLTMRGQKVDIGGFLNPEDRTSFAGALQAALAAARSGGPLPPSLPPPLPTGAAG